MEARGRTVVYLLEPRRISNRLDIPIAVVKSGNIQPQSLREDLCLGTDFVGIQGFGSIRGRRDEIIVEASAFETAIERDVSHGEIREPMFETQAPRRLSKRCVLRICDGWGNRGG